MSYFVKLSDGYSFYISKDTYKILFEALEHRCSFVELYIKYDKFLQDANHSILVNINQIIYIMESNIK